MSRVEELNGKSVCFSEKCDSPLQPAYVKVCSSCGSDSLKSYESIILDRGLSGIRDSLDSLIESNSPGSNDFLLSLIEFQKAHSVPAIFYMELINLLRLAGLEVVSEKRRARKSSKVPLTEDVLNNLKSAIITLKDKSTKRALIEESKIDESLWSEAIWSLLSSGQIVKEGVGRGTRYIPVEVK